MDVCGRRGSGDLCRSAAYVQGQSEDMLRTMTLRHRYPYPGWCRSEGGRVRMALGKRPHPILGAGGRPRPRMVRITLQHRTVGDLLPDPCLYAGPSTRGDGQEGKQKASGRRAPYFEGLRNVLRAERVLDYRWR